MAQVMVNFRIDEDVKKNMEQACKEMGLNMTAAFTIFATKVGKEKRIPFEITAGQSSAGSRQPQFRYSEVEPTRGDELLQTQKRLERLCARLRQSLTAIHVAIPASITGLTMEHIRLLCGDELKDKAKGVSDACQRLFSQRNGSMWQKKDTAILDGYADGLSSIAEELLDLEHTLIPAMKSCQSAASEDFVPCEQRLAALSRRFDELAPVMQQFLNSTAPGGGGQTAAARLRKSAATVETPYVQTALENLEKLVLRCWNQMEEQTAARVETDYLQTLELTLRELGQTEREGGETGGKAALCLRVINVLSQVLSESGQVQREWRQRSLEAEVEALERLAAMRGDISGGIRPEE